MLGSDRRLWRRFHIGLLLEGTHPKYHQYNLCPKPYTGPGQVSLWYILRTPKYPMSIYHNDTWTIWDCDRARGATIRTSTPGATPSAFGVRAALASTHRLHSSSFFGLPYRILNNQDADVLLLMLPELATCNSLTSGSTFSSVASSVGLNRISACLCTALPPPAVSTVYIVARHRRVTVINVLGPCTCRL